MTESLPAPETYPALVAALKERIRDARLRTAVGVNRELILLYWEIGRDILLRQSAEGWGTAVLDRLARDLRRDFPAMTDLSPRTRNICGLSPRPGPTRQSCNSLLHNFPRVITPACWKPLSNPRGAPGTPASAGVGPSLAHQIAGRLIDRADKVWTNFGRTQPSPLSDLAR